jgi:GAF domain-containing protein
MATAINIIEKPNQQSPRTDWVEESNPAMAPLLGLAVDQTQSQGAYVYSFDPAGASARLVGWAGLSLGDAPVAVPLDAARHHLNRNAPLVVHEQASSDARFAGLPEFALHRFEGVASIPLIESGAVIGILNVCRSRRSGLQGSALAFLLSLSVPVSALVAGEAARAGLRRKIDNLNQRLADRKLLDRAKGLLQTRFQWSEEQAYLHLRNISRRRRTPLRAIAAEVINGFAPAERPV